MLKIQSLLRFTITSIKSVKKSMYKKSVVMVVGSTVISIILINSTLFGGSGKNGLTAFAQMHTEENYLGEELEAVVPSDFEEQEIRTLSLEDYNIIESELLTSLETIDQTSEVIDEEREKQLQEKAKQLVNEPSVKASSDQLLSISKKDYEALLKIVEAEATGQDEKGKILVANVILNRVESSRFPNEIYEVIHQTNQFSPITDGRYNSVNVTSSTKTAVEKALKGEDYSNGALFFIAKASASSVSWFENNLTKVNEYQGHTFYK